MVIDHIREQLDLLEEACFTVPLEQGMSEEGLAEILNLLKVSNALIYKTVDARLRGEGIAKRQRHQESDVDHE